MNIVFLGTPEIARVCLAEILTTKHKVLAVVTNPDRPAGRGKKLTPSPVKTFALEKGLKVLEFSNVSKEGVEIIKSLKPDALVLVAFGQILSPEILDIALPINLHGSLLPALRGPSPIQSAILNGLTESGVSVMKMAKGVDSGDVLLQEKVQILPTDNSGTLFNKMAQVGAKAICCALDVIEKKQDVWTPQNHKQATYCQMLTKENAKLDFCDTTQNIINKIRAYNPNPVAFFEINGEKFKVFSANQVTYNTNNNLPCGTVCEASPKNGLIIKTQNGFLEILEMQAPNSKRMPAKSYLSGKKIEVGTVIE